MLIQLKNLHKSYGTHVLFDGASATFSKGQKIGVIGRNGAGKSTLCRLITGEEEAESGELTRSSQLRLGYLEQRSPYEAGEEVLAFLKRSTQKEEWRCAKVAGRFQLKGELLSRPVDALPGGFQTRVKLASMLIREPNFLLLDEPTNYLDLKTLLLLERFLRGFSGGYLIVSHDREFLKRTCAETLEVARGRLESFPGDVDAYLAFKAEQDELKLRYNKNVEAKKKHLQEFVDRYRVRAATASRAQSKLKQIERLKQFDVDMPESSVRIKLPQVEPKKGTALACQGLAIGYAEKTVAEDIHFDIERGEHVAVVGDNGEGKTTFLRTIAGDLDGRGGTYKWGYGVETAYYAQHVYSELNPKLQVVEQLERAAAHDVTRQEILDLAGSFLFQGDDVHKPISVLSGGERARVSLAGILLSKRAVLLLDEPTNHLDFETVEALAQALERYAGTVFFVSHDRTFTERVATNVVEVKGGGVRLYPGAYDLYVRRTEQDIDADQEADAGVTRSSPRSRANDYTRRKELRARVSKLKKKAAQAEKQVGEYQEEIETLNQHYLKNPLDDSREKRERLQTLRRLVEDAESNWLLLHEELETAEAELGEV